MTKKRGKEILDDSKKRTNETWDDDEDKVMLELLDAERIKGNKVAGAWLNTMWPGVLQSFKEKTGKVKTKDHVTNRMRTWRGTYRKVAELVNKSGFGWDPETGKVVAEDWQWKELIADKPEFRKYRIDGCPTYGLLQSVVGENIAQGNEALCLNGEGSSNTGGCFDEPSSRRGSPPPHVDLGGDENSHFDEDATQSITYKEGQRRKSDRRKRKAIDVHAEEIQSGIVGALNEMTSVLKVFAEKDKKTEQVIKALGEIPNLDLDLKFRAPRYLKDMEDKESFLMMDPMERIKWLEWCKVNRA